MSASVVHQPTLLFPSPSCHTPAQLAPESGKDPCAHRGATLFHLFPNYLEHKSRCINWIVVPIRYNQHQPRPSSPLTLIPDKICMEIDNFVLLFWPPSDISTDHLEVPLIAITSQMLSDWQTQSKVYTNSVITLYLLRGL